MNEDLAKIARKNFQNIVEKSYDVAFCQIATEREMNTCIEVVKLILEPTGASLDDIPIRLRRLAVVEILNIVKAFGENKQWCNRIIAMVMLTLILTSKEYEGR